MRAIAAAAAFTWLGPRGQGILNLARSPQQRCRMSPCMQSGAGRKAGKSVELTLISSDRPTRLALRKENDQT
jgi:hypothetical protein